MNSQFVNKVFVNIELIVYYQKSEAHKQVDQ